jgi:hypothetical protein
MHRGAEIIVVDRWLGLDAIFSKGAEERRKAIVRRRRRVSAFGIARIEDRNS